MSRRSLLASVAGGAALVVTAALVTGPDQAAQASVTTNQVYPVPASRVFTLHGHGWGHGHGMSQHGAQGAALAGRSTQQILDFYYPGTTSVVARNKMIRVLITADTTDPVVVLPTAGLSVRDLSDRATYQLPTGIGATRWRLRVGAAGNNAVEYRKAGKWNRWRPGGAVALEGLGEFFADGPVTLRTPSGDRAYRGALRHAAPAPDSTARDTVNVVSLDNYVKGVIPAEMPASWEPAAVRSQAVAARTYATHDRAANLNRYYQTCDTTACQVYAGVSAEDPRSNAAAKATAGQIRTYGGKPAFTQFSSSSGGWTSAGSVPYLVSKQDPYDDWSGNPNHDWTAKLSAARIRDAYPGIGRLLRIRVTQREGGGQWHGRIERMVLEGGKGKRTITGDELRSRFALKSTWLTFG